MLERVETGAEFAKNTTFLGSKFVNHPVKKQAEAP